MPKTTRHFPQFGNMPEKVLQDTPHALRQFPLLPEMSQKTAQGHNAVKTGMENTQAFTRKPQTLTLRIMQLTVSPPELVPKTESAPPPAQPYRNRRSEWLDWLYLLSSLLHAGVSRFNQYRERTIPEYKRLIAPPALAVDEDDKPPAHASVPSSKQPKEPVKRHHNYWETRYVIICPGFTMLTSLTCPSFH